MPFTFPAHAVPCIPLKERFPSLDGTVLLVGTMAPDLCYIFKISELYSHSVLYSFFLTIPITILFSFWIKRYFGVVLKRYFSDVLFVNLNSMIHHKTTSKLKVLLSAIIGISTHIVLDGFTHHGWWPNRLLFVNLTQNSTLILWIILSVLGTIYVWRIAYKKWPGKFIMFGNISIKKFALSGIIFSTLVILWFSLFEKKVGDGSLSRSISIPLILFSIIELTLLNKKEKMK